MKRYKVYAKFLGYVLPKKSLYIENCRIEKMSYKEQSRRNFESLKGWAGGGFNMNYITFPRGADFRIMKSNFVISTVLDCSSPNEAIGLAEGIFNKLIGVLMLYMSDWWINKDPKSKHRFSDYNYQICKVYEIDHDREIEIKDLKPVSTGSSMCHYPAFNELTDNFKEVLEDYLYCKDAVFIKSLKYFTNGIKGFYADLIEEKVFLDLFKSIELIINSFNRKRTRRFKVKLSYVAKRLKLNKDKQDKILELWNTRSKGDFAHARKRENYLPPQYPTPSDCEIFINWFELIYLSQEVIVNYFNYIKNRYEIQINPEQHRGLDIEEGLCEIVDQWSPRSFAFETKEKNRRKLIPLIKKQMAECFDTNVRKVKVMKSERDRIIVKIG